MKRTVQNPTPNERGEDTHPAFGQISASRHSITPGIPLFDSDILHQRTVTITVTGAIRGRELNRDWIFGTGPALIEVELSEAQWASFVSSMNTTGVPCTVRSTETDAFIPDLPYDPRLAHSITEVRDAADRAFAKAQAAMDAYDALDPKAGVKDRRAALDKLRAALRNARPNVEFAARSLTEHAEKVVQRARADIEAMVSTEATRLGLTGAQAEGLVALPAPDAREVP